jgi:predicted GTPase
VLNKKDQHAAGTSNLLPKASKDEVLAELIEVSRGLEETIKISIIRKIHVDNLIKQLTKEQEVEEERRTEKRWVIRVIFMNSEEELGSSKH